MRAGRLRHRVSVETATVTQNSLGEPTAVWGALGSRWADIEPLRGQERLIAQQVKDVVDHRIRIRYEPNIDAGSRITWTDKANNTRTFNVIAVLNIDERNVEMELAVREESP